MKEGKGIRLSQGDIWLARLDPVKGGEQHGFRPVVIVSGNMLNKHMPVVFAMPLTTKIKHYKGNPIIDPDMDNGLKETSEGLVFHIRSMSRECLTEKIGTVKPAVIKQAIDTLQDLLHY